MTIGERIRARRKELGLSVAEVATALGVSAATVYRYENGQIEKIPGAVVPALANVLHTSREALMGWSTDDTSPAFAAPNPTDPLIAFYGTLKDQLDETDKADLMAFMRIRAALKHPSTPEQDPFDNRKETNL